MGFSAGGGRAKVKSDINVTPLVDVVLVLLIIFLVTMPILMKDISVDIPKKAEDSVPADLLPDQITLEWKDDGRLLMNTVEVARTDLAQKLREKLERKRDKIVFVSFDDGVRYGDAVGLMDTCKGAGATTVALKTRDDGPAIPASPAR